MKKRGISAVVATILIILIVVVGVGIVWKVVLPIFAELEFLSYSDVRLNIVFQGHTVYDPNQNFAFVQIERGKDEVNVTGIEIGFNFDGTTKTYQSKKVPTPNGKYTYKFNFTNDSEFGIPEDVAPDKVTVAPIFTINNKERLGKILDEKPMPSGRIHLSAEAWKKANDEAAIPIVVTTGGGDGDEPGEPVVPEEPVCTVTGIEVCGNDVDEDCVGGADDGCELQGYFFAGTGSVGDPYIIENCYQLQNMSFDLTADYELKKDVDCSMTNTWDNGDGFNPVGNDSNKFTGSFDGNDFKIGALFIDRGIDGVGLFGVIVAGEVKNVRFTNLVVGGNQKVGGVIGVASDAIIRNIHVSGEINGLENVGGIIGVALDSPVEDSSSSVTIWGENITGGIAGRVESDYLPWLIVNSSNSGSVRGYNYLGGIAGESKWSSIKGSINSGSVEGISNIGGIVGITLLGSVINSSNTGLIRGENRIGGIAGAATSYLKNVSNEGQVKGFATSTGGIVGFTSSWVSNSHNSGQVEGTVEVGGIAGTSSSLGSKIFVTSNTGIINGTTHVGGITGYSNSLIINSYNTGSVTGSIFVGGIIGSSFDSSNITNSYNAGSVIGSENVGGVVGEASYSSIRREVYYLNTSCSVSCNPYGILKTDAELKNEGNYTNWDFNGIWTIDQGTSYSYLVDNEQVPHPGI